MTGNDKLFSDWYHDKRHGNSPQGNQGLYFIIVVVTTVAIRRAKVQSNHHQQQTNYELLLISNIAHLKRGRTVHVYNIVDTKSYFTVLLCLVISFNKDISTF